MQTQETGFSHSSVMPEEVLGLIGVANRDLIVDATLGLGGHTEAILEASPTVKVIGIDQDNAAIAMAERRLARFSTRLKIEHGNFAEIREIVKRVDLGQPDAVIADLGVSSLQLDDAERGFSFRFDAPLDMRMDPASGGRTAAELLAETNETDLANIIYQFGEERFSRRIAKWIVERNKLGEPITSTKELADLVGRAVKRNPKDKIHPATRTFQALRIAVNAELDVLKSFIFDSVDCLKEGGVLAVITFHSLEDRIVKHLFQKLSGKCECPPRIPQCVCGAVKKVEILTKKPVVPGDVELKENPRSRSAKLRACRKLGL